MESNTNSGLSYRLHPLYFIPIIIVVIVVNFTGKYKNCDWNGHTRCSEIVIVKFL